MKYAMVLLNRVIGVEEQEMHWPPDPSGNPVITVQCDDTVILGMTYNPDTGEFTEYVPEPVTPEEPQETQLDRIEKLLGQQYSDIQKEAVDAYTLELIKEGAI